jgi:hypothetical protein
MDLGLSPATHFQIDGLDAAIGVTSTKSSRRSLIPTPLSARAACLQAKKHRAQGPPSPLQETIPLSFALPAAAVLASLNGLVCQRAPLCGDPTSEMGHSRRFGGVEPISGCPLTADVAAGYAIGR